MYDREIGFLLSWKDTIPVLNYVQMEPQAKLINFFI